MKDDNRLDLGVEKYGFQHAIKATVRLRAGGATKEAWSRQNICWVVLEQHMTLCSGGVQRQVDCRGVTLGGAIVEGGNVVKSIYRFFEHELEACEPFPCEEEKKPESAQTGTDTNSPDEG